MLDRALDEGVFDLQGGERRPMPVPEGETRMFSTRRRTVFQPPGWAVAPPSLRIAIQIGGDRASLMLADPSDRHRRARINGARID
jgi:hypothetical protein